MRVFLNLLIVLVTLIIVIGAMATIAHCQEYTYESDVDPKQFFNYTLIHAEQMGGNRILLTLKGETYPKYVLNLVIVTPQRQVMILAYCYYDKEFNFKNFGLGKKGHYSERKLKPKVEQSLRLQLNQLHGLDSTKVKTKGGMYEPVYI